MRQHTSLKTMAGETLPKRREKSNDAAWFLCGLAGVAIVAGGAFALRARIRAEEETALLGRRRRRRGWTPRLLKGHGAKAIKVQRSITVQRSIVDVYQAWRQFEILPRAMGHVERITLSERPRNGDLGPQRMHWVVKGPVGTRLEWDAEITEERTNELIAWRSVEGADVDSSGRVAFKRLSSGMGTEITIALRYQPPAGKAGSAIASLLGESPKRAIREDLRRFKALMETGEVPTIEGQPRGK